MLLVELKVEGQGLGLIPCRATSWLVGREANLLTLQGTVALAQIHKHASHVSERTLWVVWGGDWPVKWRVDWRSQTGQPAHLTGWFSPSPYPSFIHAVHSEAMKLTWVSAASDCDSDLGVPFSRARDGRSPQRLTIEWRDECRMQNAEWDFAA